MALPDKSDPKEDWLTRSEAARLIWAAWRARQKMGEGITDRDVGRHVARFMLVGFYTGTRHGAICSAALTPAVGRGYVDTDSGVFYRRRQGARQTNKRQPPVRLPARLLAHLRRWKRLGIARHAVVEWNGKPVASVRKSFARQTLGRHRPPHHAAHLPAHGGDLGNAAGLRHLGSGRLPRHEPELLERVDGHHHPDFQSDVAERIVGTETGQKPREQNGTSAMNATKNTNFSRGSK